MRSTITLNGKNSNTIEGLLIQSLPPISKPLMRTTIEEIDGRDGDIVTNLGFSAYTKEFTIGLYGNYDINEVIAYFASEGTVIFSNEPDKYYNYQIIDQIDYERLIRFRTATVSMHCQPFKYSDTEGTEIYEDSSNLVTIPNFTRTTNGVTVSVVDGHMTVSGESTAATEFYVPITPLSLAAGSYMMSAVGSGVNPEACSLRVIYNSPSNANSFGGNYVTLRNNADVSLSATLTATKTYNYVYLYIAGGQDMDFVLNLEIIDKAQTHVAGEDTNLALENTGEAPFSKFDIKGDTFQNTISGKNLLVYPYQSTSMTNGITFTSNSDGTVILNGTNNNSGNSAFYFVRSSSPSLELPAGTYYMIPISNPAAYYSLYDGTTYYNFNADNGWTVTLNSAITVSAFYVIVKKGNATVFDNMKIYPMLSTQSGQTESDYEPYVGANPSPNPDYPQEVQVVTGTQIIKINGKNLFDSYDIANHSHSGTATIVIEQDGTIVMSGNSSVNGYTRITNTPLKVLAPNLKAGQTYYLYVDSDWDHNNAKRIYLQGSSSYWGNGSSHTITQAELDSDVVIYGGYDHTTHLKIMITTTSDTNYEPYNGQTYTINLGSNELCKIGTYQDKIYKDGADWYIHKEIRKVDVSALSGWFYSNSTNFKTKTTDISDLLFVTENDQLAFILCKDYTVGDAGNAYSGRYDYGIGLSKDLGMFIRNKDITSLANFTTYLANNQIYAYAALATPTDTKITDTNLIEQLDALYKEAHAYNTRTHMASSATGTNLPHIMSVDVIKGMGNITVTNSGNYIAKPLMTIFGSGDIGVYLNGNQVFQIALGDLQYITIDTAAMEAYKDTLNNLQNRIVTGDYSNFALKSGANTISFSGSVEKFEISKYSRWL